MTMTTTKAAAAAAAIHIERRPFHSPEAAILIKALDQELSDMYPDWPNLPHPGENIGLRRSLVNVNERAQDTTENVSRNVLSILDDAEPGLGKSDMGMKGDDDDDEEEKEDELILFIAYVVDGGEIEDEEKKKEEKEKDSNNKSTDFRSSSSSSSTSSLPTSQQTKKGIGCMGIKVQKFYPHHHAPEEFLTQPDQDRVRREIQHNSDVKTAQLKRLYVDLSCRSGAFSPSVATRLLRHLEDYAKRQMGVGRLVVETGIRQIGAIKLYERAGWCKMANFGDYANSSVEMGGVSVCYQKLL